MSEKFFDPFFNVREKNFQHHHLPHLRSPKFLGKIAARNKNLLQGIIGFGREILADTPRNPN
jgi:hypothetical protein